MVFLTITATSVSLFLTKHCQCEPHTVELGATTHVSDIDLMRTNLVLVKLVGLEGLIVVVRVKEAKQRYNIIEP